MSPIFVGGIGAVSPAGWGVRTLRNALWNNEAAAVQDLARPGWEKPLRVRQVPVPEPRPDFLSHPRLRRCSSITRFAVAAALEALGKDAAAVNDGLMRLGLICCAMSGCVNYSRRFYQEVLTEPATASPMLFPETVFNAPASHIAALLGRVELNYTFVGDPGGFLQGLAAGAQWLASDQVDGCLVVGAEETDWVTSDSFRMFAKRMILSEGAGAIYLRRDSKPGVRVQLDVITDSILLKHELRRLDAVKITRQQLPDGVADSLLVDGTQDLRHYDAPEIEVWRDWAGTRLSPKKLLGEGLMAAAAWQCVAAIDALQQGRCSDAHVSTLGCNQQAIGGLFSRTEA